MKKIAILTVVVVALLPLTAGAIPTARLDSLGYGGFYGGYFAGEYNLTVVGIPGITKITTFCVEIQEHISIGKWYDAELNDKAIGGGVGLEGDPISGATAALYHDYLAGDFNPMNDSTAKLLGKTFWSLEGEIPIPISGSEKAAYDSALAGAWADIRGVGVLNLYALGSNHSCPENWRQDMLVELPIPAPGAFLLASLGCLVLARVRRAWQ